ncbi:MAG: carboxypeptidase regulatory-like domain-containing protein [Actinobacteria bacterium]|nr:carboxypeptidase regulatory-like domain-containing protein [Actinomycetota bacterium]
MAPSLVIALLALALSTSATAPGPALAGQFTIATCQANGSYSSGAFQDFATRGMKWRRACNPLGPGLRGLVTANVPGEGHVAQGSQSAFVLEAPPATTFSSLSWSGYAHRRDCRYALQLYAVRPDGSTDTIRNVRANQGCPKPKSAQGQSWPRPTGYELGGATKIVQRVVCVGAPQTGYCSAKGQNYLQTFTAEATVIDEVPPSVSVLPGGPLVAGEWVSGTQGFGYEASDNAGVKTVQAWVAGASRAEDAQGCDYTQRIPCPSGPGQIDVETAHLPEGTQQLHLTATDAAGNQAESSPVTVRIDYTPPGAVPVSVEGGEAWRNRDSFALLWQNPPEEDRAPIVAAHWRLCRVGTQECQAGTATGPSVSRFGGLTVPGPGEWEAQVWRQDAAGNTQPQNASVPVRLRFDPEPPEIGFVPISPQDPTRVAVHVADKVSGVMGGEVELSRVGSGVWQPLPTTLEGEELVTRIDDAVLPAGEYQLRATATDRAGNEAATESRIDGTPMKMTLPLRVPTSLTAGVLDRRVQKKVVRRNGHRRVVRHQVSHVAPEATVAVGHKVGFSGRLIDKAGNPVAGATVTVYQQVPEEAEVQVATVTTGAEGGFDYEVTADSSRRVRFAYAGTATTLPSEGSAELLVRAASTLKVRPQHVLNGGSVTFSGRVEGRPLPPSGKLVELEVHLSHEWSTFRTIRSDPNGEWSIEYPFKRTCGVEEYGFRAELPGEAGFPLEPGHSPTVTVTVRGRPCPTA